MHPIKKAVSIVGAVALIISIVTFEWDLSIVDLLFLFGMVYGKQLPAGNIIEWLSTAIVAIVSGLIIFLTALIIWVLVSI